MDMMLARYDWWQINALTAPCVAVRNAVFESFIIHARSLDDFFRTMDQPTRDNSRRDTLYAWKFSPCTNLKVGTTAPDKNDKHDLITRMHGEVVHLRDRRKTRPEDRQWEGSEIVKKLKPAREEFLQMVDTKHALLLDAHANRATTKKLLKRFQHGKPSEHHAPMSTGTSSSSSPI